jgi:hypothetical protein
MVRLILQKMVVENKHGTESYRVRDPCTKAQKKSKHKIELLGFLLQYPSSNPQLIG